MVVKKKKHDERDLRLVFKRCTSNHRIIKHECHGGTLILVSDTVRKLVQISFFVCREVVYWWPMCLVKLVGIMYVCSHILPCYIFI